MDAWICPCDGGGFGSGGTEIDELPAGGFHGAGADVCGGFGLEEHDFFAFFVEVEPFAHRGTVNRITDVLAEFDISMLPVLRKKDGQAFVTDGGNLIFDIACGRIEDPAGLAHALKSVTGVVDHGLFLDLAEVALIGGAEGVTTLEP